MAMQIMEQIAPTRLCGTLAALLNAVDAADDRGLIDDAEALLHPLGVAGWPAGVTAWRVASWGLTTRQVSLVIDALRRLGVRP